MIYNYPTMNISFVLSDELYENFSKRIINQGITCDEACVKAIELFLKTPVPRKSKTGTDADYFAKARYKIPIWAKKTEQYNHKIIKAYFLAKRISGNVTITHMLGLCSEPEHPELYIPGNAFLSNYRQMKYDGPKSHGKVFEDDGANVWIWEKVEDVLNSYANDFYHE